MVNRATKRLMAKQEAAAERERARRTPLVAGAGRGGSSGGPGKPTREGGRFRRRGEAGSEPAREGRIKRFRKFLKEVRIELKKVAWPSRGEVLVYTVVVLVSVTFVTLYVFGLDFAFGNGLIKVFFK